MTRDSKWVASMGLACALAVALIPAAAHPHGDVKPQPVDTTGLKPLGDSWREVNPYRGDETAIRIGKSAYNQQCARCHGLGGVSGGFAPDLRRLPPGDEGDKEFVPAVRRGVNRNGRALMPKYEGIVSQEAIWAIRSWLESVHVE